MMDGFNITEGITLTPELIRQTALNELAKNIAGIKQAELIRQVEAFLSYDFDLTAYSVRNAVWNLSDVFPEYVIKKKLSYRSVLLFPTESLIEAVRSVNEDMVTVDARVAEAPTINKPKAYSAMLGFKVMDIARYVEFSEIEDLINELIEVHSRDINIRDLELAFGMKKILEELRRYRNKIAHFD
jgi:translation elongation factor EF-1beta